MTAFAVVALVTALAIVPLAVPASSAAPTLAASDAAMYVATTGDDVSTNPCTTEDAPCLTVSGAVARAQTAITDGAVDVIVNIAAGTYTENVVIGSVASGHSLSLRGAAASTTIIHGLGNASVISITSGVVIMEGLSITGGSAVNGGGIYNNDGTLTVSDSTVSGNTGTSTGATQGGGGIHNNTGTVSVSDSTVSGNTATGLTQSFGGGAGIFNNAGTLTVSDSTVSDNNALTGYAGGIFNNTGTATVSNSTVSGNSGWYVGGINNRGTLNVSGSTVSDNIATRVFGGGISNYGGTMTVANSTLSGNSAANANTGKGGAIYNRGIATVTNSTLSGNSAYQGGGIWTQSNLLTLSNSTLSGNTHTVTLAGAVRPGGGIWMDSSPYAKISNSILSGSSCNQKWAVDGGSNVSDDSSCFTTTGPTSIQASTTIRLAPLAANGSTGPKTMAIDSTSSAHHLVPGCTGTDARGQARPGFGGTANCDAGAYELQAIAPAVTTDPQSKTLAIGLDATFTAAASGTPNPTVQWQVNTGSAWADVPGATATTLTLMGVMRGMSGNQYRAVFTNGTASDATTAAATLTVPLGALHHLVISPSSGSFVAGGSRAFTAEGFDSFDNSLGDVTASTVFAGSTGLSCTGASCSSSAAGTYTVTGTNGVATGTASVTVTAAALDYLVVSPSSATMVADGSRAFTAEGFDSFGNSLGDVTAATVFVGSTGMSCAAASCTSTAVGSYTVTGTNGVASGTASVTVTAAALDYLVVSPGSGTFVAGGSQVFTAEGFDSFGNSLGDMTAATVFVGSTRLSCTVASCTSSAAGTYTVTGTNGAATGTASVTVTAIPEVNLPITKPLASGQLTGVPATINSGGQFTATASGFAPYSPVTFGIYSTALVLGQAIADSNGSALAHLQIPAGFAGSHTVVAAGMDPSLAAIYLEAQVLVVPAEGAAKPAPNGQLAITGLDANLNALSAVGLLLLMCGSLISIASFRRRRHG